MGECRLEKKKNQQVAINVLLILALFLLNCCISRQWIVKSLVIDDIALYNFYKNSSFFQFVYNGGEKIRPVSHFFIWFFLKLFGGDPLSVGAFLPWINWGLSIYILFIAKSVTKNSYISLGISCVYLISRFAYYSDLQLFGIMEMSGLFFSVTLLWMLIKYIDGENKYFWYALVMYVLATFSHERYFVLAILLAAAVIMKNWNERKQWLKSLIPIAFALFYVALNKIAFGDAALQGTGGVSLADSFNLRSFFSNAFKEVSCIFGWQSLDAYLGGPFQSQISRIILAMVGIVDLCIFFVFIMFLIAMRSMKENVPVIIKKSFIYILFIGLCIACSSGTIRVEMRWIYTPYVAALLFFGYMISVITTNSTKRAAVFLAAITLTGFVCIESHYRSFWENIYLVSSLKTFNSLVEIVNHYGNLENKTITVIDKNNIITEDDIRTHISFLFADDCDYTIQIVNSAKEIKNSNSIVLKFENGIFVDESSVVNEILQDVVYSTGRYEDGWAKNDVTIEITPKDSLDYKLTFYTNEDLSEIDTSARRVEVFVNQEKVDEFTFDGSYYEYYLNLPSFLVNEVEVKANFVSHTITRDGEGLCYTLKCESV